jgi:hypothetical protein
MTHIITLPGDWNHPGLLFRLLEVVETPWTITETGRFADLETGRTTGIAWGPRIDGFREAFENGVDLTRQPLSDAFLDAVDQHRAVVQVHGDRTPDDPVDGLLFALRAANALLDGGALGLHLASSGLVYEADAFQASMKLVEAEDDPTDRVFDLVVRYQVGAVSTTIGMDAFDLPDIVLADAEGADRAVGRMEATARRLLRGESIPTVVDSRGGGRPNPAGIVIL